MNQRHSKEKFKNKMIIYSSFAAIVLKHARLVFESAGYRKFVKPGGVSEALEDFKSFHPKNYKNGSEAVRCRLISSSRLTLLDFKFQSTQFKPYLKDFVKRASNEWELNN